MEWRGLLFLKAGLILSMLTALPMVSAAQKTPMLIQKPAAATKKLEQNTLKERRVLSSVTRKTTQRTWTVQRVEPPKTAITKQVECKPGLQQPSADPQMVFATVEEHGSFLYWHFDGERYEAWSELDFSLLGGVVEYSKEGKRHTTFIMAQRSEGKEHATIDVSNTQDGLVLLSDSSENEAASAVVYDLLELYESNTEHFNNKKKQPVIASKDKDQSAIDVNCWKVAKEVGE